jgi:hypothetical protein
MKKLLLSILTFTAFSFGANAQWTQVGLDINGEAGGDESGYSVSLSDDGSIMAVGATRNDGNALDAGHVRIYQNTAGTWSQMGNDINGVAMNDLFGNAVSLSANGLTVAIGGIGRDGNGVNAGHVRVFTNVVGNWNQLGNDIHGEVAGDLSGHSVSLSDDGLIVAIGAKENDGGHQNGGHVRIFQNVSGNWIQVGADIDGEAAGDYSGHSVSLSGDGSIVAIGAEGNDAGGSNKGHVRVYENINGTWTQIGVDIDGEANADLSGSSVSLSNDGSIVAIGAKENDGGGTQAGHVRVYENVSGTWSQIGADINGEASPDYSGSSVSLSDDGSIVAIGAAGNDGTGGSGANYGHVRVYENVSGTWTQVDTEINGEAVADGSGSSVCLNSAGTTLAIGAINNDGNGANSGHVRVYSNGGVPCTVNIPDANFKAYLVGNTAINTNADTEIQCSEATAFTGMINCTNASISDLTGIEAFISLTELGFSLNSVSIVDVTQNIALTYLDCRNNSLSALDVTQNTALIELFCNSNSITNLNVNNNTILTGLFCNNNLITSLNVSNNTNLIDLKCETNSLISLDVSQNIALTRLWCDNNQLTSLNATNGNNTNITLFNAHSNPNLTCIQVGDAAYSTTNWTNIDAQTSFSTNCNGTVGINELKSTTMTISPNPTKELLNIKTTSTIEQVTIYSISGSLVKNINQNINRVNVEDLTEGMYILVIKTENGITRNRFIKE